MFSAPTDAAEIYVVAMLGEAHGPRDALDVTVVSIAQRLARTPWWWRVLVGVALTVGVLGLDWWSGPTLSVLLGYSVAVPLIAWMFSARWPAVSAAILMSGASAALILVADDNLVATRIVLVNAAFRAASLVLLAVIVSAFRRHLLRTERLARFDDLSGALSRYAILFELDAALALSQQTGIPTSVVYFDLDGLKSVNDVAGHHAGDRVIRQFASSARSSIGARAHFGRIGGDEFLLVCPVADPAEAVEVVERIGACDGIPAFSWGLAVSRPDDDHTAMIARADAAMYATKHHNASTFTVTHGADDHSAPDQSMDQLVGGRGPLLPRRHKRLVRTFRPGGWSLRPKRRSRS